MALINKDQILNYIPQKPPIAMVHELLENSDTHTVSSFEVLSENMFCADDKLSEPGLIENIAQTAALRMGYLASQQTGDAEPPVGFIGAISKLKIHELPNVGETLQTRVDILNDVFGVTLIKGVSSADGKPFAECEMKIVIQNAS